MEQDFAVTLIDQLIDEAQNVEAMIGRPSLGNAYDAAKKSLAQLRTDAIQALRVPKGGDQYVWDRFAAAALSGILAGTSERGSMLSAEASARHSAEAADAMIAERSRREAQP